MIWGALTSVFLREAEGDRCTGSGGAAMGDAGRGWSNAATSQGMPAATGAGEGKEQTLPSSLQKEHGPAGNLILSQWYCFWTCGLRNCERTNFCCFKSPHLR